MLTPVTGEKKVVFPDFMARLKKIYGDRVRQVRRAELIRMDRIPPSAAYERAILLSRQHTRVLGTSGMDVIDVAIGIKRH